MMTTANVGADTFLTAFSSAVDARSHDLQAVYANSRAVTDLMLGRDAFDHDGVLRNVAAQLRARIPEIEYKREWYTIDALMVSGQETIHAPSKPSSDGTKLWYPSRLEVIIEHENEGKIEEEMWKLLFWHAGLKVLISYDWYESDKEKSERKCKWAEEKVEQLRVMWRKVTAFTQDRAPFLLILGNREKRGVGPVEWRWCRLDMDNELHDLHLTR